MAETSDLQEDIENAIATALDATADSDTRIDAICAMCDVAPRPERVHDTLIALLADEDEDVRSECVAGLQDVPTTRAIEGLIAAIEREKSSNPRWIYGVAINQLCEALGACGEGDPRAIAAIVGQLRVEASMYASQGAFAALTAMGPRAAQAKDALEHIAVSGRPWERAHAHLALWAQDGALERHVRAIVPILAETKEGGGSAAAAAKFALEQIGEPAIAVLERPDVANGPLEKHAKRAIEGIRARVAKRTAMKRR